MVRPGAGSRKDRVRFPLGGGGASRSRRRSLSLGALYSVRRRDGSPGAAHASVALGVRGRAGHPPDPS